MSPPTVGRLVQTLDNAVHVNAKKIEASAAHPDRATQFASISEQRQECADAGLPMLSVDTKKTEVIGTFKNAGRAWGQEAEAVTVHDFRTQSDGRAVPYGIYDLPHNRGTVCVGSSGATAQFAVAAIGQWWQTTGQMAYPQAHHLLLLADGGGSNSCRSRLWKQQVQEQLCDALGLMVTVCHYPPGCSKWNPIEHRLFGPISLNWAGRPLRTWETVLAYLRGTTTTTGLEVAAIRLQSHFATGVRVSDAEMATLNLTAHGVCPSWNYTLRPRSDASPAPVLTPSKREVIL